MLIFRFLVYFDFRPFIKEKGEVAMLVHYKGHIIKNPIRLKDFFMKLGRNEVLCPPPPP